MTASKEYDCIDAFAGIAVPSTCWRAAGYHVATMELEYGDGSERHAMNILSPAGMSLWPQL